MTIKKNWQEILTADQYRITREGGTEAAFSGPYTSNKEAGIYHCICCQSILFNSKHKFDSGSGWPSYWQSINDTAIKNITDNSHGMTRVEVRCASCDAHLGHVFEDGPPPTGQRYCINSISLEFVARTESTGDK